MKQSVLNVAELLIQSNGKTSTLEVKNHLYAMNAADPKFNVTQKEVSALMSDLFSEGKLTRTMVNENGFNFYRYELANVQNRPATQVNYPKAFGLLNAALGDIVCYVSGQPNLYVQGNTRKDARKECFRQYKRQGIVWDNINTCTVKYYNNKLV